MKNIGLGVGKRMPRWELKGWAAQCLPTIHKVLRSVKRRGHPWEENGAEGCIQVNSQSWFKSAFAIVSFLCAFGDDTWVLRISFLKIVCVCVMKTFKTWKNMKRKVCSSNQLLSALHFSSHPLVEHIYVSISFVDIHGLVWIILTVMSTHYFLN